MTCVDDDAFFASDGESCSFRCIFIMISPVTVHWKWLKIVSWTWSKWFLLSLKPHWQYLEPCNYFVGGKRSFFFWTKLLISSASTMEIDLERWSVWWVRVQSQCFVIYYPNRCSIRWTMHHWTLRIRTDWRRYPNDYWISNKFSRRHCASVTF